MTLTLVSLSTSSSKLEAGASIILTEWCLARTRTTMGFSNCMSARLGANNVARYDGVTGQPIGNYIPAGSGGLSIPFGLTFGRRATFFTLRAEEQIKFSSTMLRRERAWEWLQVRELHTHVW